MLMPVHARMARSALKWSFVELSAKSGVSKNTLVRFESGQGIHHNTAIKIEAAFNKAGVIFLFEDATRGPGIQLSKELVRRMREKTGIHAAERTRRQRSKAE